MTLRQKIVTALVVGFALALGLYLGFVFGRYTLIREWSRPYTLRVITAASHAT
jgi:hypothetical protein